MATETVRNRDFYAIAGYNAYRLGVANTANPYPAGDQRNKDWAQGWNHAKKTKAAPMSVSAASKLCGCRATAR